MKLDIFTVFDNAANAFLPPFYMHNEQMAYRAMKECLADENHKFSQHSPDFTLFKLGSYDDTTAKFDMLSSPRNLAPLLALKGQMLEEQKQQQEQPIPAENPQDQPDIKLA